MICIIFGDGYAKMKISGAWNSNCETLGPEQIFKNRFRDLRKPHGLASCADFNRCLRKGKLIPQIGLNE